MPAMRVTAMGEPTRFTPANRWLLRRCHCHFRQDTRKRIKKVASINNTSKGGKTTFRDPRLLASANASCGGRPSQSRICAAVSAWPPLPIRAARLKDHSAVRTTGLRTQHWCSHLGARQRHEINPCRKSCAVQQNKLGGLNDTDIRNRGVPERRVHVLRDRKGHICGVTRKAFGNYGSG